VGGVPQVPIEAVWTFTQVEGPGVGYLLPANGHFLSPTSNSAAPKVSQWLDFREGSPGALPSLETLLSLRPVSEEDPAGPYVIQWERKWPSFQFIRAPPTTSESIYTARVGEPWLLRTLTGEPYTPGVSTGPFTIQLAEKPSLYMQCRMDWLKDYEAKVALAEIPPVAAPADYVCPPDPTDGVTVIPHRTRPMIGFRTPTPVSLQDMYTAICGWVSRTASLAGKPYTVMVWDGPECSASEGCWNPTDGVRGQIVLTIEVMRQVVRSRVFPGFAWTPSGDHPGPWAYKARRMHVPVPR